jgi:signal transduction histidine kinase
MTFQLPRSLFGRMTGVLLAGLIVGQLLSMAIHRHERSHMVARYNSLMAAQRIKDIVRMSDAIDSHSRQSFMNSFQEPDWHITYDGEKASKGWLNEFGHPQLQSALNDLQDSGYQVQIRTHNTLPKVFLVQVQLHDRSWVNIRFSLPSEASSWPSRMLLQLFILIISVLAVSLIAVRWVTNPLMHLANAAEELGKDIHRPALDEQGPTEVSLAAHAFNKMQTRLVRYIQNQTQLLTAISHDLKTPITRLRLRTELLEDSNLRAKFEKDLEDMEKMVMATLDFMRGADQQEVMHPIDIMALLESLQADAQEMKHDVFIKGSVSAPYFGRPLAIKRCLSNLIDNAIKYGKCAKIEIEDHPDLLTIIVRDQGPGIPEDQLDKVFEPFYRLEGSRSRNSGGTGLGLSIARNIAQLHGGKLSAQNSSGGGLKIVLTMPHTKPI